MKLCLFLFLASIEIMVYGQEMDLNVPYLSDTFYCELNYKNSEVLVIFIAGSGPTDRDGNGLGFVNNSLKELSDALAAQHISTFRFDKRGVGKSYFKNLREENVTIDSLKYDVLYLKNYIQKKYSFKRVFLLGHSEGSLLSILAMNIDSSLDGLISLAGAGLPADSILLTQIADQPNSVQSQVKEYLTLLRNGIRIPDIDMDYYALFRPSVQPYMISWLRYDPSNEIRKTNKPMLIIQGTADIQVDTINAEMLHKNAQTSEIVILKNMNHVLKNVSNMEDNMKSYNDLSFKIHEDLPRAIVEFIRKH